MWCRFWKTAAVLVRLGAWVFVHFNGFSSFIVSWQVSLATLMDVYFYIMTEGIEDDNEVELRLKGVACYLTIDYEQGKFKISPCSQRRTWLKEVRSGVYEERGAFNYVVNIDVLCAIVESHTFSSHWYTFRWFIETILIHREAPSG